MTGVLGMFAGALAYVLLYPTLEPLINALGNAGKVTLPEVTGTAAWMWVAALAVGGAAALLVSARHVGGGPKQPTGGSLGRPQAAT
jgi:hypothetical protein